MRPFYGVKAAKVNTKTKKDFNTDTIPSLAMLKAMPYSTDARQQMLEECRSYYHGNSRELAIIDEFENNYHSDNAIYWYTRPCFLFRLINKALRAEDIVALHTFRYFITDLSTKLDEARREIPIVRVYRGTKLSRTEVEKYQVGNLVASNGFLSSSCDIEVAKIFCGIDPNNGTSPSRSRNDSYQYVLFDIEIDHDHLSDIILSDISNYSACPNENEMLFDMGTTFEIVSVNYDDEHFLWNIRMRTSADAIHLHKEYQRYVFERMKETNADVLFGIFLTDRGDYRQSLDYFKRLLARMPENHEDRANAYYGAARVYRFNGQYRLAMQLLRSAERLLRAKLPQSKFDLARTLAGIGSVYYEMHDYGRELLYYKRAMFIYREILPNDHIEMARSCNRLGFAHANQKKYKKALRYFTQSLAIFNKTVPDSHPDATETLCNIGRVYQSLERIDESLQFYHKGLAEFEKILPEDHPRIASVCYQLGICYKEQHQHNLALQYAQRALAIREKKLPPEHIQIREVKQLIEML